MNGDCCFNVSFREAVHIKGDDGKDLEFLWNGTKLGVRQEGQTEYQFVELKGATGEQGEQGETGNGIDHITLNADYTLTVYYTDGTSYTTTSIRGETGKSAYQAAVEAGYEGTEEEFNESARQITSGASEAAQSESNAASSASAAEQSATDAETAQNAAETAASHYPYIGSNGHWFVWDVSDGEYVDTGVDAQGTAGKSAYEAAVEAGYTGTEAQFNIALAGFPFISSLIPSQATSQNQLADKDFVNSSINSVSAFPITYNALGGGFPTIGDLTGASVYYSGGAVRVPTTNDYAFVAADTSEATVVSGYDSFTTTAQYIGYYVMYNSVATLVASDNKDSVGITPGTTVAYVAIPSTRYVYSIPAGQTTGAWNFQTIVTPISLTAAQVKAINSSITAALVAKITANENAIADILAHTVEMRVTFTDDTTATYNVLHKVTT